MGDNKLVGEYNLIAGDSTSLSVTEGTPIVVDDHTRASDAANEPNKESGATEHITAKNPKPEVDPVVSKCLINGAELEDLITERLIALNRDKREWEELVRQSEERVASLIELSRRVSGVRMSMCQRGLRLSKY